MSKSKSQIPKKVGQGIWHQIKNSKPSTTVYTPMTPALLTKLVEDIWNSATHNPATHNPELVIFCGRKDINYWEKLMKDYETV